MPLTRLAPDDLPPHQTLELPLSDASVRKIGEISNRSASLRVYDTHLKKSAELLRDAVGNINETLAERTAQLEATAERRRERGGDKPREGEEALIESVTRLKESVGGLTAQVERGARTTIDLQMELEDERQALLAMASRIDARQREDRQRQLDREQERSAMEAAGGSRSQRRRRKRRRTDGDAKRENGDEDEEGEEGEGEEEDGDDDDEDDDITNTYQGPPAASALSILTEERAIRAATYTEMSAHQKYGLNNDYIAFKQMLHVSMFPDDDVQLPDATHWFDASGEPAPYGPNAGDGAGGDGRDNGAGDFDGDGDDDLVVQREVISFLCPLSLVTMQDPYRSTVCKHTFEHSAIIEYLRPAGSRNGTTPKKCPQTGCDKVYTAADLVPDTTMRHRIQHAAKRERRRQDAAAAATSDVEGEADGNGDNDAEHAQDVDDIVDASQMRRMTKAESEARTVKRERFQRTQ